jgi:hypothetical protein
MTFLIGDLSAKVGKKDIFKPTSGNESLHEIINDNGIRVVNFATSKTLTIKNTIFPHRNRNTGSDSTDIAQILYGEVQSKETKRVRR